MEQRISVLQHEEFGELEVVMIDGKPYFPASACANILGYANPRKAVLDHCKHVLKRDGVSRTTNQHGVTTGQTVSANYIPEGDVYRLIARSRLPAAQRFERWIFDEALPKLRQNGYYIASLSPESSDHIAQLARTYLAMRQGTQEDSI